jgi:hypothetical protein
MAATIAALLLAALLASCVPDYGEGSSAPGAGSGASTLPPPIASEPPGRPSPTLEVPPPIN